MSLNECDIAMGEVPGLRLSWTIISQSCGVGLRIRVWVEYFRVMGVRFLCQVLKVRVRLGFRLKTNMLFNARL